MAAYNGNGNDYARQVMDEAQQRLQGIYQQAVQRAEQADREIQSFCEGFKGIQSTNLQAQQQLDRQLGQHLENLDLIAEQQRQRTQQYYDECFGMIEQFGQSPANWLEGIYDRS